MCIRGMNFCERALFVKNFWATVMGRGGARNSQKVEGPGGGGGGSLSLVSDQWLLMYTHTCTRDKDNSLLPLYGATIYYCFHCGRVAQQYMLIYCAPEYMASSYTT